MTLTFCGANREVTGSCYLLTTQSYRIVIDCGMFQGGKYAEEKNAHPFPFDPASIDAVLLTHAHFDHTGRLPKLYKEGFRGPIWCTGPTSELAMITLRDSVHLIEDEAKRDDEQPLYSKQDVEPLQDLWKSLKYDQWVDIFPSVSVYFSDAGHILGSASISVRADGKLLVFSGDLGNPPVPILRPTEFIDAADVVIIESTYGNRVHEPAHARMDLLQTAIQQTKQKNGTLIIPAFALERTQELLYEINLLNLEKKVPTLPVYLDSPMAIEATEVFQHHKEYFNPEAQHLLNRDDNIFGFPGLKITRTAQESKAILTQKGAKVIIAGSGMMNGGRVLHHLHNYLHIPSTTLLIIGYQVEGSLGRQLHDGAKSVRIYGQEENVRAKVTSCGAFSGHADQPRLMHWIGGFHHQPPRKVYVCHGELNAALSFSESIEQTLHIPAGVPSFGDTVNIA
jgi:metallo-beta-lactamase family protein